MLKLLGAAVALTMAYVSSAAAATITTTGTAASISDGRFLAGGLTGFQPFDTQLGSLTGVTLDVHAGIDVAYNFISPPGSHSTSIQGVAPIILANANGALNLGVSISGQQTTEVAVFGSFGNTLRGQGSLIFEVMPADFALFLSQVQLTDPPFQAGAGQLLHGTANLQALPLTLPPSTSVIGDQVFLTVNATYRYVPTPVPEPSAWMLALAGFGMIGAAMRGKSRRRRLAA